MIERERKQENVVYSHHLALKKSYLIDDRW